MIADFVPSWPPSALGMRPLAANARIAARAPVMVVYLYLVDKSPP
jgi:hypothetical protein